MFEGAPFYITLPCDSCLDIYPKNTSAEWKTKLHQPIHLKGKWEVCLAEVQYTNTLWTLQEDQQIVLTQITSFQPQRREWVTEDFKITVKAGLYRDPFDDIIKLINDQVPVTKEFFLKLNDPANDKAGVTTESGALYKNGGDKALTFSLRDNRIHVTMDSPRVYLTFPQGSETLMAMFGLEARNNFIKHENLARDIWKNWSTLEPAWKTETIRQVLIKPSWKWAAPRLFDPTAGKQILYVYCSVADFSFLGNEKAQILRTLAVSGKYGDIKTDRFDAGHYVPVLGSLFEDIQVTIANETGDNAHFHSGKSIIKLHFRPHRSY